MQDIGSNPTQELRQLQDKMHFYAANQTGAKPKKQDKKPKQLAANFNNF